MPLLFVPINNMKVYYSINDAIDWLATHMNKSGVSADISGGWGHFVELMQDALVSSNIELVDSPLDADIEFHVGQPILYQKPQMSPSVMFSMNETTGLPKYWIDTYNKFDEIIVPCDWNKHHYKLSGVTSPIHKVHLSVDKDRFPYIQRTIGKLWCYLGQSVKLIDRKNIWKVGEIFKHNKMPSDTLLVIKTNPQKGDMPFRSFLHNQIVMFNEKMSYDDMIKEVHTKCNVSVNPSSGEGIGLIPLESMSTGMISIQTAYSGLTESLHPEYNLALNYKEKTSNLISMGGMDADPDLDHLYELMLWTYEHQEESLEMGKMASKWVQETFTKERMANDVINILGRCVNTIPKKMHNIYNANDDISEWVNLEAVNIFGYNN